MSYGVAKSEDLGTPLGVDKDGIPDLDPRIQAEMRAA